MKVASTILSLLLVDKVGRRTLLLCGCCCMAACLFALTIFAGYEYAAVGYHHRESCSHAPTNVSPTSALTLTTSVPFISDDIIMNNLTGSISFNTSHHIHKNVFSHVQHFNKNVSSLCDDETSKIPFGLRYLSFIALVLYVAAFSFSFGPVTWILLTELFPVSLKGQAMSVGQAVNWSANVFVSATFIDAVRVMTLPFVFLVYFIFSILSIIFIYKYVPETKGKSLEEISKELKETRRSNNKKCSQSRRFSSTHDSVDFMKLQDSAF